MARVVVDVMPKAEILDPQGQAIVGALGRLGFTGIGDVRQGKRFELEVDDTVDDVTLERCRGAEDAVDQVTDRTAEHESQTDRPAPGLQPAAVADDDGHDDQRDDRQHPGVSRGQ